MVLRMRAAFACAKFRISSTNRLGRDPFLECQIRIRLTQNADAIAKAPIVVRVSRKILHRAPYALGRLTADVTVGVKIPSIFRFDRAHNGRHPLVTGEL